MMKFKSHISLILAILPFSLAAQVKYSNDFLNIGVGARASGMSRSVIANGADVTSAYWNPAALTELSKDIQLGIMHSDYYSGMAQYDYAAAAVKADSNSALAITVIRFGIDDIQNTLELYDANGNLDYNRISYFGAVDYAFIGSYAQKTPIKGLSFGANMKIIRRIIGEFADSWGFGLDAAMRYQHKNWMFGAVGKDITGTFNAWNFNEELLSGIFAATENTMPDNALEVTTPQLILGVSRSFPIHQKFSLLPEVDFDIFFDGKRHELIRSNFASASPHMGLQFDYDKKVYVRAGISNIQKTTDLDKDYYSFLPSIGVGIHFLYFDIDYAMSDVGDHSLTPYSHIFSLNIGFDKSK